jgi:hypothetical protein
LVMDSVGEFVRRFLRKEGGSKEGVGQVKTTEDPITGPVPTEVRSSDGGLPEYVMEYTLGIQPNTVSDGELKPGRAEFLVFPGVASCVPIVVTDGDTGETVLAIHASPRWTPEMLEQELRAKVRRNVKIEYLERTALDPGQNRNLRLDSKNRIQILGWLGSQPNATKIIFPTASIIDNIGYQKGKGFGKIVFKK